MFQLHFFQNWCFAQPDDLIHIWISVSVFCVIIFPIPDTKKDSIVQCWGGYPLGA